MADSSNLTRDTIKSSEEPPWRDHTSQQANTRDDLSLSNQQAVSKHPTLEDLCPWVKTLPAHLRAKLQWNQDTTDIHPGKDILLLYCGPDGADSLPAHLIGLHPHLSERIIPIDIKRKDPSSSQDMLEDTLFSSLCGKALRGGLTFVGGGPNCRTWSILRWFPKPGAPTPVRGRSSTQAWGLETNSVAEQEDTDNDSLLLLRQMVITDLANQHTPGGVYSFLEHPEDPKLCSKSPSAGKCSTIWILPEYRQWAYRQRHSRISFDQCVLGQLVKKSTTLSTNLDLHHWHDCRCNHDSHSSPPGTTSSDLSRYPPYMMGGIARAIGEALATNEADTSSSGEGAMGTLSTEAHGSDGQSTREPPGRTDRPSCLPMSSTMTVDDDPMIVQLGFKTRPLRDGGGKPSLGRRPPHLRPTSILKQKGDALLELAKPLVPDVLQSTRQGSKQHPFSEDTLQIARTILASELPLTAAEVEHVSAGQPFHLLLLSELAKSGRDPDWKYPQDLQLGVPLGVTTPTWSSPGIWPTKDELRGMDAELEELDHPLGRDNYKSAEEFQEAIRTTFEEEKRMGMVEGPYTEQEAAERCKCSPSELCPGPMAAIDEGDKVRTIYDGSWGGANAHIQNNTSEKTTSPTVMDCVQAIQWLIKSQKDPGETVAVGTDRAWRPPSRDVTWALLKADVTKAHRRIKVTREGWKYQVAQLNGSWWINKVGTYGMASAQLYWGRLAALLLRQLYLLFPGVD